MPEFLVRWEIDIFDAADERDAADIAQAIQRDPDSQATHFEVFQAGGQGEGVFVDLGSNHNDQEVTA